MIAMPTDDDLHGRVASLETWKQVIDAWKAAVDKLHATLEQADVARRKLDDERHAGNLARFGKIDDHLAQQDKAADRRDAVLETVSKTTTAIQLRLAGDDGAAGREDKIKKEEAASEALLASKRNNQIAIGSLIVAALALILTAVWALHK
jgi:hypothetical protein